MAFFQQPVDTPPQHAFASFNACRKSQWLCDAVVLAWEPADKHVELGNSPRPGINFIQNFGNILIYAGAFAEAFFVASPSKLLAFLPHGFPLVGPNRMERTSGFHVEVVAFFAVAV